MSDNFEEMFAKIFQKMDLLENENDHQENFEMKKDKNESTEQIQQESIKEQLFKKECSTQLKPMENNEIISQSELMDSSEVIKQFKKELELVDLDKQFYKYFEDYCKISYLKDIKNEDLYIINKWKFIFYHCIMLDGLFQTANYIKKNAQKKMPKEEKKISFENSSEFSSSNSRTNITNEDIFKKSQSFTSTNSLNDQSNNSSKKNSKNDENISDDGKNEDNNKNKMQNDIKNNIIYEVKSNDNLNEFKLKEAKAYLKIYDSEFVNGKEYEFNCKRMIRIMMILIQKDNYFIYNPSKIPIQKLMNLSKVKEEKNIKLTEADCFEIDVVINNFKVKDFNLLMEYFPKHFLMTEKLEDSDKKINIIGEISRNFIGQIKEKARQIKIYNIIFKIIEYLKSEQNTKNKQYILSKLNLEDINNDYLFLIITDGSYVVLNFVINLIKKIKEKKFECQKYIKEYIQKETEKNKLILEILADGKYRFLNDLIYETYETILFLDESKIKYGILFIGDNDGNEIELFYKQIKEKQKKININFIKKIKGLINGLIYQRNELTQKLEDMTKSYYKDILSNFSYVCTKKIERSLKLKTNYFNVDLKVILSNKNISINNTRFNITTSNLSEKSFNKKLEKIQKNSDFEKLYIFVNSKSNSKNQINNKNVLIIDEKEINKFEQIVIEHINANPSILENQIKKKVINKIAKIQIDNLNILNYDELINIFENDQDYSINIKNLINIIEKRLNEKGFHIDNINEYINYLIENKTNLENILSTKFVNDFRQILKNNFERIKENILSSIIFNFLLDKIEGLIYSKVYEFYEK